MLQLTVHKNLDPSQPVIFTGRRHDTILRKLREWMEGNNGEWCDSKGLRPCLVDGLCFVDADGDSIVLAWCDCYEEWSVEDYRRTDILTNDAYMFEDCDTLVTGTWNEALDEYINLARDFGRFEEV